MGGNFGCLVDAASVSPEAIRGLVSRVGATRVFVRGAMSLRGLRSKAPVPLREGRGPGVELSDDDSVLRAGLQAVRDAGADPYVVLSNPFIGLRGWTEVLARDSGGRSSADVDPDRAVLCPSQPKLLRWITAAAEEAAKLYKPAGLLLENFSVGSPDKIDTLFMCWCDLCQSRAAELGYDADRLRIGMQGMRSKLSEEHPNASGIRNVGLGQFLELVGYDTGLLDWFNFRADLVSACLYDVRRAVSGVDAALGVTILSAAPTVAMFGGQRRADLVRDETLCDCYAPVLCGPTSRALETIASHAEALRKALPGIRGADALVLSARMHGYGDVPMPGSADLLRRAPGRDVVLAGATRELELVAAGRGSVPCWPAIDVAGLAAESADAVARQVKDSGCEGVIYCGMRNAE